MELEQVVRDWMGPVYNLAYRMLGNEADAADATQETFVRILRAIDTYDPARGPLRPWIFRIAANTVRSQIRKQATRQEKERAAGHRPAWSEDSRVEQRDMQALVHEQLGKLPEEERTLLALHYYSGLSKRDVALALELPRTTVQSRMRRALELLKRRLRNAGHVAVVPVVEDVMRSTPPVAAGPAVTASVLKLVPATGAAVLAAGGIVMSKKILIAAVFACGLLSVGYVVGHERADRRPAVRTATRHHEGAPADELARVTAERDKLARELATLRATGAGSEPAGAASAGGGAERPAQEAIDWAHLAALMTNGFEAMQRTIGDDTKGRTPSPADQAKVLEIFNAFVQAAQQARETSSMPFFETTILPPLVDAIFAGPLELSARQRDTLKARARELLDKHLGDADPKTMLPVERYRARTALVRDLRAALADIVPPARRDERFDRAGEIAQHILEGNRRSVRAGLPLDGNTADAQAFVVEEWARAFGLTDGQLGLARECARQFTAGAAEALRRYGRHVENAPPLDEKQEAALRDEMFRLQIEQERRIAEILTPDQVKALERSLPVAIAFTAGGGGRNIEQRHGPGF